VRHHCLSLEVVKSDADAVSPRVFSLYRLQVLRDCQFQTIQIRSTYLRGYVLIMSASQSSQPLPLTYVLGGVSRTRSPCKARH